jgi:hypothetical protein
MPVMALREHAASPRTRAGSAERHCAPIRCIAGKRRYRLAGQAICHRRNRSRYEARQGCSFVTFGARGDGKLPRSGSTVRESVGGTVRKGGVPSEARRDDRLLLSEGLIPAEGTMRAGAQAPALGRRDVGPAARQRMRDLVAQTELFVMDPAVALPHYPLWDMNRGFGP